MCCLDANLSLCLTVTRAHINYLGLPHPKVHNCPVDFARELTEADFIAARDAAARFHALVPLERLVRYHLLFLARAPPSPLPAPVRARLPPAPPLVPTNVPHPLLFQPSPPSKMTSFRCIYLAPGRTFPAKRPDLLAFPAAFSAPFSTFCSQNIHMR